MADAPGTVLLIHGLARTARSLGPMGLALRAAGYRVEPLAYPSTKAPAEALVAQVAQAIAAGATRRPAGPLHAVTHSMGALILRDWLARSAPDNFGRAVLLGPPNHGSELVDRLGGDPRLGPAFRLLNGPAGLDLGTGPGSWPNRLPPPAHPMGVIAGTGSVSPWFSALLPGPDDGKVTVASTRMEGMADHLVLPVSHTWMMMDPRVIRQVLAFLREGRFQRG
ncbi:lipase family protein [Xinfangfangia pollutisoli]|uniref:alpha/beta hydrolase n=1 Tax=Xinfangfangia pollutisoli TaxID=2865960 RepID=UPI001CD23EED|nr:alpha/beta hydrolase [Xinfangfangia pollutisoli]